MNQMLTTCPVCSDRLSITRLHCRNCDTVIEGYFEIGRLGRLSAEQLEFVETFLRCEGKLSRMDPELDMSYPTLRARLTDIIRTMGFQLGPQTAGLDEEERLQILEDLASGKLSSDEAMRLLESD
jgi:hypothetical protein